MAGEPYQPGDKAASFARDEQYVYVREATVEHVTQIDEDVFVVVTDQGVHRVDPIGLGDDLVPIDEELAKDFAKHPYGFVLMESLTDFDHDTVDLAPALTQELKADTLEQERDGHAW